MREIFANEIEYISGGNDINVYLNYNAWGMFYSAVAPASGAQRAGVEYIYPGYFTEGDQSFHLMPISCFTDGDHYKKRAYARGS